MNYPVVVDKNIIYLRSDFVPKNASLVNKLIQLGGDCTGEFMGVCGPYTSCISYVILYYKSVDGLDETNFLEDFAIDRIKGYAITVIFDFMSEIYDLCVSKSNRKMGVARSIISSIIKMSIKDKIWLGIDINNPHFNEVAKLYIKHGFLNPEVYYFTPNGIDISSLTIIGLTFVKDRQVSVNDIYEDLERIKDMRQQLLKIKETCNHTFTISKTLINTIHSYISQYVEYAGILRIMGYDSLNRGIIGFPTESEVKGNQKSFTVEVPNKKAYFFFHTHPEICYKSFGCFIGWPSGADMSVTFLRYVKTGLIAHFVFTKEGLYAIQLSPIMQILAQKIRSSKICIQKISKLVYDKFTFSSEFGESLRLNKQVNTLGEEFFLKPENKRAIQTQYFKKVNNYGIFDLVEDVETQLDDSKDVFLVKSCIEESKIIGNPLLFNVFFLDYNELNNYGDNIEIYLQTVEDKEKLVSSCPLKVDYNNNNGTFIV